MIPQKFWIQHWKEVLIWGLAYLFFAYFILGLTTEPLMPAPFAWLLLLLGLPAIPVAAVVSFLPSLIAFDRKTKRKKEILLLNIFFPLILTWIMALDLALSGEVEDVQNSNPES